MGAAENRQRLRSALLFGLVALAGVAVVLYAWKLPPFTTPVQSTENALVKGQVTLISPQVTGYVAQVLVQDFQQVHQGDLLVKIDDRTYTQRVAQAQAQWAAARANLANVAQQQRTAQAGIAQAEAGLANARAQALKAGADLRRIDELVADGSLSLRERDQARAARAQADAGTAQGQAALEIAQQGARSVQVNRAGLEAAVQSAEAALQLARIDLANTEIRAPRDGQLGQVSVRAGAYVSAGTQLTAVVPDRLWIMANMKETQMARVAIGQPASFVVDALDKARLTGHVERISPATGSEFSVIPPDNATGNFVKIAQRIPVYIAIDPDQPLSTRLRPGMSVVVSVDTAAAPARQHAAADTGEVRP
jgi:multidrug resistance efflux pump